MLQNRHISDWLLHGVNKWGGVFSAGNAPLTWTARVQIALDAARGLEYLHEHTKTHYVHRDVKTSNILLDTYFCAKVLLLQYESSAKSPLLLVDHCPTVFPEKSLQLCNPWLPWFTIKSNWLYIKMDLRKSLPSRQFVLFNSFSWGEGSYVAVEKQRNHSISLAIHGLDGFKNAECREGSHGYTSMMSLCLTDDSNATLCRLQILD